MSGGWESLEDDIDPDMLSGCTGRCYGRARGKENASFLKVGALYSHPYGMLAFL